MLSVCVCIWPLKLITDNAKKDNGLLLQQLQKNAAEKSGRKRQKLDGNYGVCGAKIEQRRKIKEPKNGMQPHSVNSAAIWSVKGKGDYG